jgi:hypothetical protein
LITATNDGSDYTINCPTGDPSIFERMNPQTFWQSALAQDY